jgi:hypothetical protein
MQSEAKGTRCIWVVLAALTLAGALLRFGGLGRLLPQLREPDAFIVYELQAREGDPALVSSMNFHERYPLLLARALSLLPYPAVPAHADAADFESVQLAACARPFWMTRFLIASLACLLVPLTFFLARRFSSAPAALAAAFFVATSLLHILYSGEARPHGAHATLALAAVLAALRASERPNAPRLALAGLAAVLAIGSLQTGLFVLPPLAVAILLAERGAGGAPDAGVRGAPRARAWRALWPALALPIAAAGAGILLFYPTLPYIDASGIHTAAAEGGGHSIPFEYLNAMGLWRAGVELWMHDPIFSILTASGIVLGVAWWWRERKSLAAPRKRMLAIAAVYALPYLLVISVNGEVYERFLMPLLPYCACFAGGAVVWILGRVRSMLAAGSARSCATALVVAACAAWPTFAAVQFTRVARQPDTLQQTAEFLKRNARPEVDSILTSPSIALPLLYTPAAIADDLRDPAGRVTPWIVYQGLLEPRDDGIARYSIHLFPSKLAAKPQPDEIELARAYLDEHRPDWVVLEVSRMMMRLSMMRSLLRVVAERGEIAFKSRGSAPAVLSLGPIDYQDIDDLALRIVETEAFGPPIVVFRMKH